MFWSWFEEITIAAKVYFIIAIVASVFLVIQVIMLLVSLGGGDIDMEGDADVGGIDEMDVADGGLSFFTIKTLTAFFTLGGWCGFAAQLALGDNVWAPILIAMVTGSAGFFGMAFAMRGLAKLQCSGNLVKNKLVGTTANVYVSIPNARSGRGKITLTAQGRYIEIDAMTDDQYRIPVNSVVEIVEYSGDFALVKRASTSVTEK